MMKYKMKKRNFFFFLCGKLWLFFFFSLIMSEVHIASMNVNGARNSKKRAQIFEEIVQKNIDIAFLQETHSSIDNVVDWMKEFSGISVLSHHSNVSGGVAVLFSKSFKPISYDVDEIVKGRLLKVRAVYENCVFVLICVYAPTAPTERLLFLDTLCSMLKNCCTEEFLWVGGDFNCTELDIDRNHVEPHMTSRKRPPFDSFD